MSRLSIVTGAQQTPEQKELFDAIASGPRANVARGYSLVNEQGGLTGPFNAFLHVPALGKHWSALGESLRFRSKLDRRLYEMTILVISEHYRSGYEWLAHASLALKAGVEPALVDAIGRGVRPVPMKADEETVYDFVKQLLVHKNVDDKTYAKAAALLGESQLVELVHTVAYYMSLAVMMNAFAVQAPDGFKPPWSGA